MKQRHYWLLALLSIVILMTTTTLAIAEETLISGNAEVRVSGINTNDNPARVNEYGTIRSEKGLSLAPKLSLDSVGENSSLGIDVDIMGIHDQKVDFELDAMRIFRLKSHYSVLDHWKDHETLDQMGATMAGDNLGKQPTVSTDKTFYDSGLSTIGGLNPGYTPTEAGQRYYQEMDNDYIVTRREFKNEADLTLPALPNIIFHAGIRIETREGMEQAIGLSKCAGCHVSAGGKDIDERTDDLTFGVTGKFGPITVDYEYLTRNFDEDADAPGRFYAANSNSQLLYNGGDYEYARTPDSEKDTHTLKIRGDFANSTSVVGSYVKSDIESSKSGVADTSYTLQNGTTLKTEMESYGAKATTKLGKNWRFSVRASTYEIEADDNTLYFANRVGVTSKAFTSDGYEDWASAEERKVTEFGADVVYRLTSATLLRFSYGYEKIDREEEELGETETNSFKLAIKSRLTKNLSGRLSYMYQDISDPFGADHATGIYQGTGTADPLGSGLSYAIIPVDEKYWDAVYPERTLSATNQPDAVHEVKLNTTWALKPNMAATLFARVRYEENDDVHYEQSTVVPGVSFWYAPSDKVNLTMAYTYSYQDTENRACVGWYHG